LIGNAIKFTKAGSIEFGIRKNGKNLEFSVKDTGIGIFENKQQAIFEQFMQADVTNNRQFEGSGLGLSIAKSYVEMLGGKIWVESEEGKGSTFYFTIPDYNEENEKADGEITTKINNKQDQSKHLKILIVEDDATSRQFITKIVSNISNQILSATSGIEAI
jgi:CheY-like chemotaxis protein